MDLREKKTKRSIKNAFLELRSKKSLERITIKELTELAEISKATFYLHYRDIYDLSEQLQREVIQNVLNSIQIPQHRERFLSGQTNFTEALFHAFYEQQTLIDILFSDSQSALLPLSIEKELKEYIFQIVPEARNDLRFNIVLTYQIFGGFYAHQQYRKLDEYQYIDIIKDLNYLNLRYADSET